MEINGSSHLIPWLIFGICLKNVILGVDGRVGVLVKVCVANPMHLLPPKVYLNHLYYQFCWQFVLEDKFSTVRQHFDHLRKPESSTLCRNPRRYTASYN